MKQFIEAHEDLVRYVATLRKRVVEDSDRVSKEMRHIVGDATMIEVWRKILELAGDSGVTSHRQIDVTDALSIGRTTYFESVNRLVEMGALKRKGEGRGRGCRQTFIIVERAVIDGGKVEE